MELPHQVRSQTPEIGKEGRQGMSDGITEWTE